MNHHKYLDENEFESSSKIHRFIRYRIKLDYVFTEYFESKCKYYFHYGNHKFQMFDELTHRIEQLSFEDLITCSKVIFDIFYDSDEKKIDEFSINVFTYDKKNYGYWVKFVSIYNEPPF